MSMIEVNFTDSHRTDLNRLGCLRVAHVAPSRPDSHAAGGPIARTRFLGALGGSLVSMLCKVLVPRYVGYAVDQSLIRPAATRVPLGHFILALSIIAVVGFGTRLA